VDLRIGGIVSVIRAWRRTVDNSRQLFDGQYRILSREIGARIKTAIIDLPLARARGETLTPKMLIIGRPREDISYVARLRRKNAISHLSSQCEHPRINRSRGARFLITYLRARARARTDKVSGRRHNAVCVIHGQIVRSVGNEIYEPAIRATLHPGNFPATNLAASLPPSPSFSLSLSLSLPLLSCRPSIPASSLAQKSIPMEQCETGGRGREFAKEQTIRECWFL